MATPSQTYRGPGLTAALSSFVHNFAYGFAVVLGGTLAWAAGEYLLALLR